MGKAKKSAAIADKKFCKKIRTQVETILDDKEFDTMDINDPVAHKYVAMAVISRMIDWHTRCGVKAAKNGDEEMAIAWTRDAGQLQAIAKLLGSICVGDNDEVSQLYADA